MKTATIPKTPKREAVAKGSSAVENAAYPYTMNDTAKKLGVTQARISQAVVAYKLIERKIAIRVGRRIYFNDQGIDAINERRGMQGNPLGGKKGEPKKRLANKATTVTRKKEKSAPKVIKATKPIAKATKPATKPVAKVKVKAKPNNSDTQSVDTGSIEPKFSE